MIALSQTALNSFISRISLNSLNLSNFPNLPILPANEKEAPPPLHRGRGVDEKSYLM